MLPLPLRTYSMMLLGLMAGSNECACACLVRLEGGRRTLAWVLISALLCD